MSTISQHATAVQALSATIPESQRVVYISSIGDMTIYHEDGRVIAVPRALALRYLAKKTHRLATPEEIRQYDEDAAAAKHESESKRELPISAATIAAVARAVQVGHNQHNQMHHLETEDNVTQKKGKQ